MAEALAAIDHADAAPAQGELELTQEHALIRSGEDYGELFARGAAQPGTDASAVASTQNQPTDLEFKA